MKLRYKVPFIFLLVTLLVMTAIHFVLSEVVLKSYIQLETNEASRDMDRLKEALQAQVSWLDSKSTDWAHWDDAYQFVQEPNQEFIKSNIQDASLKSLRVNVMLFVNQKGEIVYSKFYDWKTPSSQDPSLWWSQFVTGQNITSVVDTTHDKQGVMLVEGMPMMIVYRQILKSTGDGPPAGMLLFGRYMDSLFLHDLSSLVKYPLDFRIFSDPALPEDFREAKKSLSSDVDTYFVRESESRIDGYVRIDDILGNPALIIEENIDRNIYQYGKRNTYFSEVLIIGVGITGTFILLIILLNHFVLSRLAGLTSEVQKIGPTGSLAKRVRNFGTDELGILAESFNRTLSHLEHMTEAKLYQEHRSQSLLTVMREAVLVVNDKNKITYANPASERLFGISQNQLQGNEISKILSFFDLHGKSLPNSFLETLFKGGAQQSEVKTEIRIKKIKQVVLISSAKLLFADRQKGVLHVFHNITSEAEIQKQKDDFFSIASHELRTPLSIIAGALDNLLHGFGGSTLSNSDTEILRGSLSSTDRLIRLVNDYLNVSRIDQQRLTVSKKEIPVFDLVQKVQKEMAPLFVKNGIVVDIDCPQQDTIVLADEDKLREVLINLLGNSVKFAPNGHIQMTLRSLEGFFEIRIQDNGIGIAPEKQKLLFTRFQQAMDDTLKRQAGGTGLGLYISREFVRLMGGELRLVESIPGKGSIFAFTLPLAVKVA